MPDERAQPGPFPAREHDGPERSSLARLDSFSPLRDHDRVPPASSSTLGLSLRLLETFHLTLSFPVRSLRDGVAQLPPSALLLDGSADRQRGGPPAPVEAR